VELRAEVQIKQSTGFQSPGAAIAVRGGHRDYRDVREATAEKVKPATGGIDLQIDSAAILLHVHAE
jgi:hypothetical protein